MKLTAWPFVGAAALAVGGNAWRRRQFAPLLIDVEHVAPTYAYRDQREDDDFSRAPTRKNDPWAIQAAFSANRRTVMRTPSLDGRMASRILCYGEGWAVI